MIHGLDTGFLVAAEVAEHPRHPGARKALSQFVAAGDRFALAPRVLAEFIHIVTDSRRFIQPLSMEDARRVAEQW
jgi:predicted nucleic acid-binding protein